MASSFITKHSLAVLALISVFIFPCILGTNSTNEENVFLFWSYTVLIIVRCDSWLTGDTHAYIPQVGAAGSGYGNIPQTGGAAGHDPETGVVGTDEPGEIFSKALLCFNDNYVSDYFSVFTTKWLISRKTYGRFLLIIAVIINGHVYLSNKR